MMNLPKTPRDVVVLTLAAFAAALAVACGSGSSGGDAEVAPSEPTISAVSSVATATPERSPTVGWEVGDRAPDFMIATLSGGTISLDALRASEKPFLLYFFATW